jgi:hypothetical protein
VQLINDAYGLVVDAVLGPGVEPAEAGGPCTRALATLKLLSIPLVSLDVPSGRQGTRGGGGRRPSLSFPSVKGACSLAEADSHARPKDGKTKAAAPGDPGPSSPVASPACPLPPLAQLPRADVSSLGKGRARPGRRPAPAGAIRPQRDA